LTALIMQQAWLNLGTSLSTWPFQDNVLSIIIPRNFKWEVLVINLLPCSITTLLKEMFFVKNSIKWFFFKFVLTEWILTMFMSFLLYINASFSLHSFYSCAVKHFCLEWSDPLLVPQRMHRVQLRNRTQTHDKL
jgi:hypothetical protein